MKVVILAGGFGTRLAEETAVLPKPMDKLRNNTDECSPS
jgi:NDP-sugar pyrophosphorylase family protein